MLLIHMVEVINELAVLAARRAGGQEARRCGLGVAAGAAGVTDWPCRWRIEALS